MKKIVNLSILYVCYVGFDWYQYSKVLRGSGHISLC